MSRLTLPRQAHYGFALIAGLFVAIPIFIQGNTTARAAAVLLLPIAMLTALVIPTRFTRWVVERRPFVGAVFLSALYLYVFVGMVMLLTVLWNNLETHSLADVAADIIEYLWSVGPAFLLFPLGLFLWVIPLALPMLLTLVFIGYFVFAHLQRRLDYI